MRSEFARRASLADQLEALFRSRPNEWISITELARVGGVGGWRTRCSELTRRTVNPLHLEHNGKNGAASGHRYVPEPAPRIVEKLDAPVLFDLYPNHG